MVAISNEITRCLNSDQEAQSELNKKKEEAEAQLQLFFKVGEWILYFDRETFRNSA